MPYKTKDCSYLTTLKANKLILVVSTPKEIIATKTYGKAFSEMNAFLTDITALRSKGLTHAFASIQLSAIESYFNPLAIVTL